MGGSPSTESPIGIGFRPELAAEILRSAPAIGCLELLLEERLSSAARAREGEALAEMFPVVVHGTKLSLGSAAGIDRSRARRLGDFARRTRAFAVTEHAAFVRAGGVEIGHLSPVPFSMEAVRVVAANVAAARRELPDVPLYLENVAWPLRPPGDAMAEADFYAELCRATGCGLLLDLGNLLANAQNAGRDPFLELERFPVEEARMIHIAGSVVRGGFTYDTHAHATPRAVFGLLRAAVPRCGVVPIVLERDHGFDWGEVRGEMGRARDAALACDARPRSGSPPALARSTDDDALGFADERGLAEEQEAFARALAGLDDDPRFDAAGIARAREILARKRVEEALPLLPRLGAHHAAVEIAEAHVARSVRPSRAAPLADARAIAEAAERDLGLRDAATLDRLALEARFRFDAAGASPRRAPWVGSAVLSHGRSWVFKGLGETASVHIFNHP